MNSPARQSTGVADLDRRLGGGLVPGTLTVVVGATGIGKTQLALHFAHAGHQQEGRRGIVFDMSARGDPQGHTEYARRMFDWTLTPVAPHRGPELDAFFDSPSDRGGYLHMFGYQGRRVTRRDLDFDQWQDWQAQVNTRLAASIAFFYGNFVQGVRRVVVDGIEPVDRPSESIQLNLFEYVYHQILRKDPQWVARDLFREKYRQNAEAAARSQYDPGRIGCMLLYTSHESMLDQLISRPLDEGDLLSNANTLIYLGKIRDGDRISRGMYVAKHRGSACTDQIVPFHINEGGIQLD